MPEKPLSTGQKIDASMAAARLAFIAGDWRAAKARIAAAKTLNEAGGDWDRRNRLKVYEGISALAGRDFARGAALLIDSIATFTAAELLPYADFMALTVLAGLKALDRPTLKKKLIDSPDVISVLGEPSAAPLRGLLAAFHGGDYRGVFAGLVAVFPAVARDRVLARHASWYLREMRVAAYAQFLESYKSVTLAGMAAAFGVRPPFLDAELARFVAAGRLNAKIDAVAGVVETTRPDAKNAQYHAVIKQGDALLNKVQRLSRVVAM